MTGDKTQDVVRAVQLCLQLTALCRILYTRADEVRNAELDAAESIVSCLAADIAEEFGMTDKELDDWATPLEDEMRERFNRLLASTMRSYADEISPTTS